MICRIDELAWKLPAGDASESGLARKAASAEVLLTHPVVYLEARGKIKALWDSEYEFVPA